MSTTVSAPATNDKDLWITFAVDGVTHQSHHFRHRSGRIIIDHDPTNSRVKITSIDSEARAIAYAMSSLLVATLVVFLVVVRGRVLLGAVTVFLTIGLCYSFVVLLYLLTGKAQVWQTQPADSNAVPPV